MESEKATERYLKRQVTKVDGLSCKWVSPQLRGVPDQICFFPNNWLVLVEVKSEGEVPKPHQVRLHNKFRSLGYRVCVVGSKAQVDSLIKRYKEENHV